jgi:hypothetical protein
MTMHSISLQQCIDINKKRKDQRECITTARDDDDRTQSDAGPIPLLQPADFCVGKENMRLALLRNRYSNP